MKRKVLWILMSFLLVASFELSSSGSQAREEAEVSRESEAKPEGTLTIGFATLAEEGFMPNIGVLVPQIRLWEMVYDYLWYMDKDTKLPRPGLIEKWEYSEDYASITCQLRKGVQFHDGWGELTVEDVVYTFEDIIQHPDSVSSWKTVLKNDLESIEVIDPYNFVFHLTKPDPLFWLNVGAVEGCACPIVCKKYVEEVGIQKAFETPIGSGPYRFVERRWGDYIEFEALEEHWRVVPEFKHIVFKIVPEPSTRISMLRTGELDVTDCPIIRMKEVEKAGFKMRVLPGAYTTFVVLGGMLLPEDTRYVEGVSRQDPWVDMRVREAMAIAIDREALNEALYEGTGVPLGINYATQGWNEVEPIPYDPERAKQLLDEAGYPEGFRVKMYSFPKDPAPELPDISLIVADYWKRIGIDVEIVTTTFSTFRPSMMSATLDGWVFAYRDSTRADYTIKLKEWSMPFVDMLMGTKYQDAGRNKLILELDKIMDIEGRMAKEKEITHYTHDNYLGIPLILCSSVEALSEKVGDWPDTIYTAPAYYPYIRHPEPLGTFRLWEP